MKKNAPNHHGGQFHLILHTHNQYKHKNIARITILQTLSVCLDIVSETIGKYDLITTLEITASVTFVCSPPSDCFYSRNAGSVPSL